MGKQSICGGSAAPNIAVGKGSFVCAYLHCNNMESLVAPRSLSMALSDLNCGIGNLECGLNFVATRAAVFGREFVDPRKRDSPNVILDYT